MVCVQLAVELWCNENAGGEVGEVEEGVEDAEVDVAIPAPGTVVVQEVSGSRAHPALFR